MAPCCFCFSVCPFNEVQTGDKLKLHGPLAGFGLVLTKSFCTGKDASHWPVVVLHRSTPSLNFFSLAHLCSAWKPCDVNTGCSCCAGVRVCE